MLSTCRQLGPRLFLSNRHNYPTAVRRGSAPRRSGRRSPPDSSTSSPKAGTRRLQEPPSRKRTAPRPFTRPRPRSTQRRMILVCPPLSPPPAWREPTCFYESIMNAAPNWG
jgi:hypothetical protein